jgi:hypothetical protein
MAVIDLACAGARTVAALSRSGSDTKQSTRSQDEDEHEHELQKFDME